MTRLRQLAVLALAAVLVTAACEAFEESPGGSVSPSKPGSTATPAAGLATPASGPATVDLRDFDRTAEGSIVRIVGQVDAWGARTIEGHQEVRLEDGRYPGLFVIAWVPVSDATPPAPNTMAELLSGFSSSDLLLTAEDGAMVRAGDTVALTGIVKQPDSGDAYLDYVTRVEVVEATAGTETPEPGVTPTPAARTVKIAAFDDAVDEEVVRVVGLIQAPGSTSTIDGHGSLHLQDATNPAREITVWVRVSAASPPSPNMMAKLPGSYKATDLLLTAEDGTAIHDGDAVALTGTVKKSTGGSAYLDYVTRIEVATAPLPKPVTVNFRTIKKQKAGTLVRLTGRLDVGFLTSCWESCGIYLEDPATGASVLIYVTLGKKNERVPNTMWPLPSNYERSDLRVIAHDKRVLKGGARVRVTGWIELGYKNERQIDPVVRIDYTP